MSFTRAKPAENAAPELRNQAEHAAPAFTPGPWSATPLVPGAKRSWAITGNLAAHNQAVDIATVEGGANTAEANARLIAAAPELYAALSWMWELCEHANPNAFSNGVTDQTGTLDEGDVIAANIMGDARRALAKAGGE